MIEGLFAARKQSFSEHPSVIPELDLVEEEDQITHSISLDDEFNIREEANYFRPDPDFLKNEAAYAAIKKELLGEGSSDEEGGSDDDGDEDDDESGDEEENAEQDNQLIEDRSSGDSVKLRLTIYLTIMSSLDFEECAHKIMLIQLAPGQEVFQIFSNFSLNRKQIIIHYSIIKTLSFFFCF